MRLNQGIKYTIFSFAISLFILACLQPEMNASGKPIEHAHTAVLSYVDSLKEVFRDHPEFYASGFDFPVGKPDAKGYYNAQGFGKNNHLGDDWNGNGGGNTDFGDPVYAISDGLVTESVNFFGGWGNVTRVVHMWKEGEKIEIRESLYAHGKELNVRKGDWVQKGEQIATIGTAEGVYLAHLHLEIRDSIGMQLGSGYSIHRTGYVDPTAFIRSHRKLK